MYCVSDRYSCKLGSIVALTRCVGSGRVLRALVVMDRFSRDRSPCLPPTSISHISGTWGQLIWLSAVPYSSCRLRFEGLQQAGSIVWLKCMLGYRSLFSLRYWFCENGDEPSGTVKGSVWCEGMWFFSGFHLILWRLRMRGVKHPFVVRCVNTRHPCLRRLSYPVIGCLRTSCVFLSNTKHNINYSATRSDCSKEHYQDFA